jgi:uncharacterized membrane protein
MTATPRIFEPSPALRRVLGPLASRPRLASAFGLGLTLMLILGLVPNDLRWSTRAVFSWDLTCLWFMGLTLMMMAGARPATIRAHAAAQDEGQGFILGLAVITAAASLAAIAAELSLAKGEHGAAKGLRVTLAFATVAASWIFMQTVFALHYAHEYYTIEVGEVGDEGGGVRGGLDFPGGEPPDYWDFWHFAIIIGVACQTADIAFSSKTQRRMGTLHGVVAFTFNTVVLALTINLLAGLF